MVDVISFLIGQRYDYEIIRVIFFDIRRRINLDLALRAHSLLMLLAY